MKANMGILDRVLRGLIAVAIVILYYTNSISGTVAIVLLVVAGVFMLTSFISFCPLYSILGFHSNKSTK
jgi:preprotein translocase subunit SecD